MFGMKRGEGVTIRCDTELLEELARRAEVEDRSVSSVARRAIVAGLRRSEDEERGKRDE
jgi:predicted transcriptional regulator